MFIACIAQAQTVWHKPEVQWNRLADDSIPATEEYTVMTVVRSLDTDTSLLLWGIMADDTLSCGVLTDGVFTRSTGPLTFSQKRDFSRWSIYYYHTGCRMDTTKHYALHIGPTMAYYTKDSVPHRDSLSAAIEMEEFLWFPYTLPRLERGSLLTYLALKYGITLDEQASYITPAGDTIWHNINDRDYYYRVVGIGVDTTHLWYSALSQTKENAEMLVSCTAGRLNEYIILGDNDGDYNWLLQPDELYRMERQWRLRKNSQAEVPVVLMWKPTGTDINPDSTWLILTNANEQQIARLLPSSIIGDTLWQFPVTLSDTLLTLQIESVGTNTARRNRAPRNNNSQPDSHNLTAQYDASGRITISGINADETYDYYLYDSAGKLIRTINDVVGSSALTGTLPTGIYHIEIIQHGQIVGDVRVVVK